MEYTILILLLPLLSFLVLGLGGKWMSHRTAGLIGTAVLGAVAVLSYLTAIHYFTAPAAGRRHICHTDALQLHMVAVYADTQH